MKIKRKVKSDFRKGIEAIKTVYRKNYTYAGVTFTGRPNSRVYRRLVMIVQRNLKINNAARGI